MREWQRFDTHNCIITLPNQEDFPAVVLYGGIRGMEGQWFLDKQDRLPPDLMKSIAFILPRHFENSCTSCLEELSAEVKKLAKISPKRVTSYSLCGFSRGGIAVYQNVNALDWEILGLIDPSAPTMAPRPLPLTVLDSRRDRIRCVYWERNWDEKLYRPRISSYVKHLRDLKVKMIEEATPHDRMPGLFFSKFSDDFFSLCLCRSASDSGELCSVDDSMGLTASVGRSGVNTKDDVATVQRLLKAAGASLKEDGACGGITISAIEDYQRNWTSEPDGRVEPGSTTWKNLAEGKLKIKREPYVMLPQVSGNGYYSYASAHRQFGTSSTITTIVDSCRSFSQKNGDLEVGIGDMCLADGATMPPHETHRSGREIDIRPLRKDKKAAGVKIDDPNYSRGLTAALVQTLRSNSNVRSILFNDATIEGVKHWARHDDHLHVSMKR